MIHNLSENTITNDIEIEKLLVELDINLIKENIKEQIMELDNNVNYINPLEVKFKTIESMFSDNEDVMAPARNYMQDLYTFVLECIMDSFDIDINIPSDTEELSTLANVAYEFLVISFVKNTSKFFTKYIVQNKKMFIQEFGNNKKDLSTTVIKKTIKNKDDVVIVSKCPSIFKSVLYTDFNEDDFLEYTKNNEFISLKMKEYVDNGIIMGNIINKYFELVRDNNDVYDTIYIRTYEKICKKLFAQ